MILNSKEFYDQFSPYYGDCSKRHENYLRKIDDLLVNDGKGALSLVDIGCGYGNRTFRLAELLDVRKITLVDSSPGMLKYCDSKNCERIFSDISDRNFFINNKYDIVLCLWNVLGHIETYEKRILALKNMRNLLSEDGKLYIDVNNRHNISQYGLFPVLRNIIGDSFIFSKGAGDFLLKIKTDTAVLQTQVHVFTYYEMIQLIKKSGLKILSRRIINYQSGKEEVSIFDGQLFFILSKE